MRKYIIADENIPYVNDFFSCFGSVKLLPAKEISSDILADANVLLVRSVTRVGEELLAGTAVKFVGTATIGVDHIDQNYIDEKHIFFTNASGSNANSVAEFVIVSLLIVCENRQVSLNGKRLGIIGVGNIGSLVAKKAAILGMVPVLYDPPKQREAGDDGRYSSIEEIYDCDFITCHVPLNKTGQDRTLHLVDSEFLSRTSDNCILINTSRGPVVDNSALKDYLKRNAGSAAILDVWENEPEPDMELLEMADIATPHIAGYSLDGKVNGTKMLYDRLCEQEGVQVVHEINDFLPALENSTIEAGFDIFSSVQSALAFILGKAYDLKADDKDMRGVLTKPSSVRADYFTALRKNYPVRREFVNWTVKNTAGSDPMNISDVLRQFGFKVI